MFNSGYRYRKLIPIQDGGIYVLNKTHNYSLPFSPAQPYLHISCVCSRRGNTTAISMAVVARSTWTRVLVDIPAHVFCPDDCVLFFIHEKRGYGLYVARLDD